MRGWSLSRVIWVADRGFTSAENRRYLRRGGNHYIIGERLRSGSPEAAAALSRQGRYQDVAGNLRVKEVRIAEDERFVIRHNPEGAERDAAIRARMIAQLKELIDGTDALAKDKRAELRGVISTKPGPEPVPAGHPRRPAAHRRRQGEGRGEPRRQVPAAHLRPEDDRRGHRPGLQAAPGSRARLARHEAGHRPAPRLPPQGRAHPRPRHPVLARPPARPRRRERLPAAPGPSCAASSTGSPSAPSPAPPAPSASAPRSPRPRPPSSNSSASTRPRRSTSSPRPRPADQRKHPP